MKRGNSGVTMKMCKAMFVLVPVILLSQSLIMFTQRNDAISPSVNHKTKMEVKKPKEPLGDLQKDKKVTDPDEKESKTSDHSKPAPTAKDETSKGSNPDKPKSEDEKDEEESPEEENGNDEGDANEEEPDIGKDTKTSERLEFVHITKTGGSAVEKAGAKQGITWGACHYMNITEVGCSSPDVPYEAPNYQSYALTSPWHTPPKLLRKYVNDDQYPYDDADLFVIIRNPYSRILSEYYCPWLGFQAKFREDTKHEKDPNDPDVMNHWVKSMITRLSKAMDEFNERKEGDEPKEQKKGLNEDKYVLAQKHYFNQAEYVYDGDEVIIKNVVHYENLSAEFDALMAKYNINATLPPKEKGGIYTDTKNKKRLSYLDLYPETIEVINEFAKPDFEKFGYKMVDKFEKDDGYSLEAKTDTKK